MVNLLLRYAAHRVRTNAFYLIKKILALFKPFDINLALMIGIRNPVRNISTRDYS